MGTSKNLSDDALEYQVLDCTSFQRFLGLEYSRRVPDAKTIWVWRERLKARDLIGDISAAVSGPLQRAGFLTRGGQIIDASIVNAPIQRNRRDENAAIKQGQVPEDWSAAKRGRKTWTRVGPGSTASRSTATSCTPTPTGAGASSVSMK